MELPSKGSYKEESAVKKYLNTKALEELDVKEIAKAAKTQSWEKFGQLMGIIYSKSESFL